MDLSSQTPLTTTWNVPTKDYVIERLRLAPVSLATKVLLASVHLARRLVLAFAVVTALAKLSKKLRLLIMEIFMSFGIKMPVCLAAVTPDITALTVPSASANTVTIPFITMTMPQLDTQTGPTSFTPRLQPQSLETIPSPSMTSLARAGRPMPLTLKRIAPQ